VSSVQSADVPRSFMYSVKIINRSKKSDYELVKLKATHQFTSLSALQDTLSNELSFNVQEMGYIQPGHGTNGKKESLIVDEDLNVMYQHYKRKHDILLWCFR